MRSLFFLVMILFSPIFCHLAHGDELLVADPQRSYVLETEVSAVLTIHGNQWVLQAQFPRSEVLDSARLRSQGNLQPTRAQLHFGPHVDVAFRVPAGPPVPPAFRDHVSHEATNLQVSFTPTPDPRRREVLVRLTLFVANGKTYRVKGPGGDEDPIPLMIRVPLP